MPITTSLLRYLPYPNKCFIFYSPYSALISTFSTSPSSFDSALSTFLFYRTFHHANCHLGFSLPPLPSLSLSSLHSFPMHHTIRDSSVLTTSSSPLIDSESDRLSPFLSISTCSSSISTFSLLPIEFRERER